jgi:predicted chitinase
MLREITDEILRDIMPNLPAAKRQLYLPFLNEAMREFEIINYLRASAFLAQLAHESAELRYFQEIASGSAYEGRKDLGNTQPGDGRKYKGHGPIQITGRTNHAACGKALGLDLIDNPTLITLPENAFRSAGWFWDTRHLNALADKRQFTEITRRINGGTNGLADRQKYYDRALRAIPENFDMSGGTVAAVPDAEHGDVEPSIIAASATESAPVANANSVAEVAPPSSSDVAPAQSTFAPPQSSALTQPAALPVQDTTNSETQTTTVSQPTPDLLAITQAPRSDASKSLWALVAGSPIVAGIGGVFKYFTQDPSLTKTVVLCITVLIVVFMIRQIILGYKREGHIGSIISGRLAHK